MEPCLCSVVLLVEPPSANPISPLILKFLILLFDDKPFSVWQGWYRGRSWAPPSCQSNLTSDPAMSPHVSITTPPPPSQVLAFSPFAIENSTSPDKGLSEQNPSAHVSITTPPRPSQIEDGSCFSALATYIPLSSSQRNSIIRTHLECSSICPSVMVIKKL